MSGAQLAALVMGVDIRGQTALQWWMAGTAGLRQHRRSRPRLCRIRQAPCDTLGHLIQLPQ